MQITAAMNAAAESWLIASRLDTQQGISRWCPAGSPSHASGLLQAGSSPCGKIQHSAWSPPTRTGEAPIGSEEMCAPSHPACWPTARSQSSLVLAGDRVEHLALVLGAEPPVERLRLHLLAVDVDLDLRVSLLLAPGGGDGPCGRPCRNRPGPAPRTRTGGCRWPSAAACRSSLAAPVVRDRGGRDRQAALRLVYDVERLLIGGGNTNRMFEAMA